MKQVLKTQLKKYELLFLLAACCLIAGLLWSRFLISLSMIFFLVFSLLSEGTFKQKWKRFLNHKSFIAVTAIFIVYTISGLWSENFDYFLNRTRIKLPFFFLPFAFAAFPVISRKVHEYIMLFFISTIVICGLWSTGMALSDLDHYIEIYGKGQIIPTPIHHIRFSLMVSVATTMCIYFADKYTHNRKKLIAAVIALTFLIIYQHLLAVRSGLMTLYIILFCYVIFVTIKKAKPIYLISGSMTFIILSFIALNFIPTIKNKVDYMRYSLEEFSKNENIRDLSDSRRLGSIYAGVQLTKENPILGVGIGDIMDDTNEYLEKHYPQLTDLELLPHNQFILSSASLGLLGLIVFCIAVFFPLLSQMAYKDYLILSNHLLFYASFMVEHTIESQIGVALYIFVILFVIKYHESIRHSD